MRGTILGFIFGGMVAGVFAGAIDVNSLVDGDDAVLILLGSMGVHILYGVFLGVFIGLLYPLIPARLTVSSMAQRIYRSLWPYETATLHDRCRTVATIWLGAGMTYLSLSGLSFGFQVILSRVAAREFAALVSALFGLALVTLVLVISAPLHAGFARILEFVVRRRPHLSLLAEPLSHAVICLLVTFIVIIKLATAESEIISVLDFRPLTAAFLVLAITLGLGEFLRVPLNRFSWTRGVQIVLVLSFFSAAAAWAGIRSVNARTAMSERGGSIKLLLTLARSPFDADGDGHANILGDEDCDDANAAVFPGAVDVPANGIDEDCDGVDAVPPAPKPKKTSVVASLGLKTPYNIVLVTCSGLRRDHVGFYGYERDTTPFIDLLATESAVFERAYAVSSRTATSLPAIFSGRYPSELIRSRGHHIKYAPENTFIAEALQQARYRTAGFPSHWYFREEYGLNQGFDVWKPFFVEKGRMENLATAEEVVTNAVSYLDGLGDDPSRPYFLWLHITDLEANYIEHIDMPRFGDLPLDRYDHEVRFADTWLGFFMETLRERTDWSRTVVILTSDHGEAFGEHGYHNHGFGLHEHQLRVPLLMRVPGFPARSVSKPISQIDLAPTIFELAGVPKSDPLRMRLDLRGENMLYTLGSEKRPTRPIHSELTAGPYHQSQQVWVDGDWKLHVLGRRGDLRLYDLSRDGGERRDLSIKEREKASELANAMKNYRDNVLRVRPPWP